MQVPELITMEKKKIILHSVDQSEFTPGVGSELNPFQIT